MTRIQYLRESCSRRFQNSRRSSKSPPLMKLYFTTKAFTSGDNCMKDSSEHISVMFERRLSKWIPYWCWKGIPGTAGCLKFSFQRNTDTVVCKACSTTNGLRTSRKPRIADNLLHCFILFSKIAAFIDFRLTNFLMVSLVGHIQKHQLEQDMRNKKGLFNRIQAFKT